MPPNKSGRGLDGKSKSTHRGVGLIVYMPCHEKQKEFGALGFPRGLGISSHLETKTTFFHVHHENPRAEMAVGEIYIPNPSKWTHGLKPAGFWWFNFDHTQMTRESRSANWACHCLHGKSWPVPWGCPTGFLGEAPSQCAITKTRDLLGSGLVWAPNFWQLGKPTRSCPEFFFKPIVWIPSLKGFSP